MFKKKHTFKSQTKIAFIDLDFAITKVFALSECNSLTIVSQRISIFAEQNTRPTYIDNEQLGMQITKQELTGYTPIQAALTLLSES